MTLTNPLSLVHFSWNALLPLSQYCETGVIVGPISKTESRKEFGYSHKGTQVVLVCVLQVLLVSSPSQYPAT